MKNPDIVFRQLGQLYEFAKELKIFRNRVKNNPDPCISADSNATYRRPARMRHTVPD